MNNAQTPLSATVADGDIISLSEIFSILIEGRWIIAGCTAVAGLIALAYCYLATPVYQADAMLQIENKGSVLGGLQNLTGLPQEEASSSAEIELVRSRMVLGRAVDALNLNIIAQPEYLPVVGKAVARRFRPSDTVPFNAPYPLTEEKAWGGEQIKVERFDVPAALIGVAFKVINKGDSAYDLYLGEDKVLTGFIGKAAADGQIGIFISQLEGRPGTRYTLINQDRNQAIRQLAGRLKVMEKGSDTGILQMVISGVNKLENQKVLNEIAQAYLRQNVARKSQEAENSLTFLETQLPLVKAELTEAENNLNSYRLRNNSVDLTMETQTLLNQIVGLETRISQLELERKQLLMNYTAEHPALKGLDEQKAYLQKQLASLIESSEELPETQVDMMRLTRKVEVSTQVYTQMLNNLQELKVVKAGTVGTVRIIDYAVSSPGAIAPRISLIMVLALLMGGILSSGLIFLRAMLNPGIKTPEEIEAKTGLSVYATIPESSQLKILERNANKQGGNYLLAKSAPGDLAIESLRSLRTNLAFALMEAPNNRIMITGPAPSVGKSFISANLAALLAESGQRVLLIDADMRKGHVHKTFGMEREAGLAEMLVGKVGKQAIKHVAEFYDLLPCGHFPPNPSELLMNPAFSQLLDKVSQDYDIVLIDTPPLLAVTDPAVVGKLCGAAFMVVRAEQNPAREITYASRRLEQAGINVKGCILNGVTRSNSRYGNYGYYQYAYN